MESPQNESEWVKEAVKIYLTKFYSWFSQQEGIVKAGTIGGSIGFLGLFVSGCFAVLAALAARSPVAQPVVITATLPASTSLPTPTLTISSSPAATATATVSRPANPQNSIFTPPIPIIRWLEDLSKKSPEIFSLSIGVSGIILIVFGLWLLWLIFFNKTEKNKKEIFAAIYVAILIFISWQMFGNRAILIVVITFGFLALIVGMIITGLLEVPYFGSALVGLLIGLLISIGVIFAFVALYPPFAGDMIIYAIIIGVSLGSVLGLVISSSTGGRWNNSQPKTTNLFGDKYPYMETWAKYGTFEVGYDGNTGITYRITGDGQLYAESNIAFSSLDDTFADIENAIERLYKPEQTEG